MEIYNDNWLVGLLALSKLQMFRLLTDKSRHR